MDEVLVQVMHSPIQAAQAVSWDAVVHHALHKVQHTGCLEIRAGLAISQECYPVLVTPQEAGGFRTYKTTACIHLDSPAECYLTRAVQLGQAGPPHAVQVGLDQRPCLER